MSLLLLQTGGTDNLLLQDGSNLLLQVTDAGGNRRRRAIVCGSSTMHWAKQSTAVSYVVGPILDSAGAEYASAVIGDMSLSKNGGTLTALASAATLTYIANGQYTLALTTGNTDTLGTGRILCNKSTYQMPMLELMVLPATVYDALTTNATTAAGGLGDIQRMAGTALTARDIGASVLLSSGTGTGQLDFTSGVVKGNVTQLLGTAWLTPGTAGTPDVNVKLWNGLTTVALPLTPTTAGRTLDVSTGGEAGVDWANVGSPTTSLALTGTTIATTQKVDVETIKTNPVVNAGTITFPTGATLASTTNITAGTITTVTTVTNQLTAAAIATGVWQDTTAGDFTVASSIGKSLYTSGAVPGAAGGLFIAGTNAATTITTSLTTTFTGNLTGSVASVSGAVGSVTGAVGSVTGNVGGNVTGSVGSVTGLTASNLDATVSSRASTAGLSQVLTMASDYNAGSLAASVAGVAGDVTGNVTGKVLGTGAGTISGTGAWVLGPSGATLATPTNITAGTITTATNVTTVNGLAANVITAASIATDAGTEIAAAVLAAGDVDGYTLEQTLKLCLAALSGKLSGAATTTVTIRAADDSKARITATVDSDGNRSAVTYDATG